MTVPNHPAKFTDVILDIIELELNARLIPGDLIWDPFAGVGSIHRFRQFRTVGTELEPEWAAADKRTVVANALLAPFADETFDAVVTSPVFGNRMSDHHNAQDASRRITYRHLLGRPLHAANAGKMQWGDTYRSFHMIAWEEMRRTLKPGGIFVLDVSDHVRKGEIIPVVDWHVQMVQRLGLTLERLQKVVTPRMRYGENHKVRVDYEVVATFRK